jgi:hypothetical protein
MVSECAWCARLNAARGATSRKTTRERPNGVDSTTKCAIRVTSVRHVGRRPVDRSLLSCAAVSRILAAPAPALIVCLLPRAPEWRRAPAEGCVGSFVDRLPPCAQHDSPLARGCDCVGAQRGGCGGAGPAAARPRGCGAGAGDSTAGGAVPFGFRVRRHPRRPRHRPRGVRAGLRGRAGGGARQHGRRHGVGPALVPQVHMQRVHRVGARRHRQPGGHGAAAQQAAAPHAHAHGEAGAVGVRVERVHVRLQLRVVQRRAVAGDGGLAGHERGKRTSRFQWTRVRVAAVLPVPGPDRGRPGPLLLGPLVPTLAADGESAGMGRPA